MANRLLITGAGGPAAIAFFNAIADAAHEVHLADMDPQAPGLYLVDESRRAILPAGRDPQFVSRLLEVCIARDIELLVPTVDFELMAIARARHTFEHAGIKVLSHGPIALAHCLDKARLMLACAGLDVTPWWGVYDERLDVAAVPFPVISKPRSGAGSRGIRRLDTPDELAEIPADGSMLLQEYLPGEEYTVDVLVERSGRVAAAVPRARLKVDSGVSVVGRTYQDSELQQAAIAVARRLRLTSIANVQFRRDHLGRPRLLEVNPRTSGTMPLTVAAGVNMPLASVQDALDQCAPSQSSDLMPFDEIVMVRMLQEHYVSAASFERFVSSAVSAPTTTARSPAMVPSEERAPA